MAKIISATTAVPLAYTDVTQRKQKTTTSSLSCSAFPIQLLSLQPLYILHRPELSFSVYITGQKHWKVKLTMSIRQGQRITEQSSSLPHANCRTGDEISWHLGKCAGKNTAIVNKSHITKLLVFSEKGVANANPVKKVYLYFQSSRVRFLTHSN